MNVDYLIVGSGLTGSVIARYLFDAGFDVLVLERRHHVGGNVYDITHQSGIRIHAYGPHYFRTNSERIWNFVNRFSSFYKYEACIKSLVDGIYENWPVSELYIKKTIGDHWRPHFYGIPKNFEEKSLSMMPKVVYEKFIKGYTQKQWGIDPRYLSSSLAGRFKVQSDNDPRLKQHKYQGIPVDGYARLMENMLSGIPVETNVDYVKNVDKYKYKKKMIYTGPIDEYFGYDSGRLKYRGQRRRHEVVKTNNYILPLGQVNNPDLNNGKYIRTLEWKHMMPPDFVNSIPISILTREYPYTPTDPDCFEYPFPDEKNKKLYNKYASRTKSMSNIIFCGRLGEYKYLDMDQAIARASKIALKIIINEKRETSESFPEPELVQV